jgi:hypothetical protein
VVRRSGVSRSRHDVDQDSMTEVRGGGKSDPTSTIQETVLERGGGENRRAPRAEKDPPPPRILKTGGVGGR